MRRGAAAVATAAVATAPDAPRHPAALATMVFVIAVAVILVVSLIVVFVVGVGLALFVVPGSHDDFATEWWYTTGHLATSDNHRYGFELTFFRVRAGEGAGAPLTAWDLRNLELAHFAITDIDEKQFHYYEKLNRASKFTANAAAGYLDVFNEGWRMTTTRDGSWRLIAADGKDAIDLVLHLGRTQGTRVVRQLLRIIRYEVEGDRYDTNPLFVGSTGTDSSTRMDDSHAATA